MSIQNASGVPKTYGRFSWSSILDAMIGSSVANNDIMTRLSGLWSRLAIGSNGQFLKVVSNLPDWETNTAGGGGTGLVALTRQATTLTINNGTTGTTFVDTDAKVTLDPGIYRFEIKNFGINATAPDTKLQLHFTGTATVKYLATFIIPGNESYFNAFEEAFDVIAVLTSGAHHTSTYRGTINVSVAGDLSLQGAQNSASATFITLVEAGSYMIAWQIG